MPSDILSVTLESKKVQCPNFSAILDSEVYISFLFIEKNSLLRYFKYSFQAVRWSIYNENTNMSQGQWVMFDIWDNWR